MISVTRLSDTAGLRTITAEWSELLERVPDAAPFQRPEWLIPWWERFGCGELHALAFRSAGRLAGLLPMFIHPWKGRRQITLVGNGITDFLDLLAEPAAAEPCARSVFDYLQKCRDRWDLADWQDLRDSSPLLRCVGRQFRHAALPHLPCTRAPLPRDPDEYEASLPHGLRRTIRLATRRLERGGELRFETVRTDPEDLVRELLRLHESRWSQKGGSSSLLDHPDAQDFLIGAAQGFSSAGKLRLYAMHYRGEPAAIICALLDRGRAWGYITGMDPALSKFSPGSLVLRFAIREAIREGATHWEFLRGSERYKFLWGAQNVPKVRLLMSHSAHLERFSEQFAAPEPVAV